MRFRKIWNNWWQRIAKPAAMLSQSDQQQAHLLITILAALLMAGAAIIPIWILTNPAYQSALPVGTGLYIGLLIAYRYSRTTHYRVGAWLLILSMYLLVTATLLTAPEALPERVLVLNFLAIVILLASLLLTPRATVFFAILSLMTVVPYFFVPQVPFAIAYSFFVFVVITAALVLTSSLIRRAYVERLRSSEESYRVLLSAMPDLMFRNKRDGTYSGYYLGMHQQPAVAPEHFMGKKVRELFPPEMAELSMAAIEKVLSTGEMVDYEYRLAGEGSEQYFEARMVQYGPDEVLTIIRNTTERHLAQTALKQSEERFSKAFRNSPVPMVISTIDHQNPLYIEANDAYLNLVGYTWDELKGRSLTEVGVPIHDERRESRRAALASKGYYAAREAQIYNHRREIRDVLISAQRVTIDGIECDLELLVDVTEQRRLEKKALELELEAKNVQILSKFIQDASHEFRTPLADISNRTYLLHQLQDPVKRQQHLEQVQKQIRAISSLLDKLLIMARLDSDVALDLAPVELNSFLRATLSTYEIALAEHKLTVQYDLSPEVPPIRINAEYIQQALRQVMDNAIRYSPDNGTITIATFATANKVHIQMRDSGAGVPPESVPHVFKRFWRHDAAHTTPGFGLGLSIAQKVLLLHGGDMTLASAVGEGTTVTMILPQSNE